MGDEEKPKRTHYKTADGATLCGYFEDDDSMTDDPVNVECERCFDLAKAILNGARRRMVFGDTVKRMDWQEFRDLGYLQEVNRRFFHPLGLALELIADDDDGTILGIGGIWDYRGDPEGIIYGNEIVLSKGARAKEKRIGDELLEREVERLKRLGFFVQPLNEAGAVEEKLTTGTATKRDPDAEAHEKLRKKRRVR